MVNVVVTILILAVLGAAVRYIVKAKKRGVKCIGCSAAGSCTQGGCAQGSCTQGGWEKPTCDGCSDESRTISDDVCGCGCGEDEDGEPPAKGNPRQEQ